MNSTNGDLDLISVILGLLLALLVSPALQTVELPGRFGARAGKLTQALAAPVSVE